MRTGPPNGRRPLTIGAVAFSLAVLAFGSSACGRSNAEGTGSSHSTLTVLAAASLSRVFPEIGHLFTQHHPGMAFHFSFGGTDLLAAQIEQGVLADVFAGASAKFGDQLFAQRLVDHPRAFATNRLVLIVPNANPANVTSVGDLATKDLRIVIGSATVPIGAYTRTVLKNLDASFGAGYSDRVLSSVVSNELDVESVLTKVRTGEADAGFVYVTEARAAGTSIRSIALPSQAQAVATYPAAVIASTSQRSLAVSFVQFLLSPEAQAVLQRAGFGPPSG